MMCNMLTRVRSSDLTPCKIADIRGESTKISVSGLVISKYEKRNVITTKNALRTMTVFNLVLRDSIKDFILVTVWGSDEAYIDSLLDSIEINSCIVIQDPVVKPKHSTENTQEVMFKPYTSSNFELVVSEGLGSRINEIATTDFLRELASRPITEDNDFYTLEDVCLQDLNEISSKDVNMLFSIREIGQVQEVQCKNGKQAAKLDLTIFDQTNYSFKLTIWDRELIKFAQQWKPKENIGLRIHENEFSKSVEASSCSKTIFILNPFSKEGFNLFNFARNVQLPEIIPAFEKFKNDAIRCTIVNLKQRLSDGKMTEFALIDGIITDFDIDCDTKKLFTFKCKKCNIIIADEIGRKCPNRNCRDQNYGYIKQVDKTFALSDHTASLTGIRMTSKLFEKITEIKIEDFMKLDDEQKLKIKWNVLFERRQALIKISCQQNLEEENDSYMKFFFKMIDLEDRE